MMAPLFSKIWTHSYSAPNSIDCSIHLNDTISSHAAGNTEEQALLLDDSSDLLQAHERDGCVRPWMKAHHTAGAPCWLKPKELFFCGATSLWHLRQQGREVIVEYVSGQIFWIPLPRATDHTRAQGVGRIKRWDLIFMNSFNLTTPGPLEPVWGY